MDKGRNRERGREGGNKGWREGGQKGGKERGGGGNGGREGGMEERREGWKEEREQVTMDTFNLYNIHLFSTGANSSREKQLVFSGIYRQR